MHLSINPPFTNPLHLLQIQCTPLQSTPVHSSPHQSNPVLFLTKCYTFHSETEVKLKCVSLEHCLDQLFTQYFSSSFSSKCPKIHQSSILIGLDLFAKLSSTCPLIHHSVDCIMFTFSLQR